MASEQRKRPEAQAQFPAEMAQGRLPQDGQPAGQALLWGRSVESVRRYVLALCRKWGLPGSDVDDACQEGLWGAWRALGKFQDVPMGTEVRYTLESFLDLVVAGSVCDFFRRWCRAERHFDRGRKAAERLEQGEDGGRGQGDGSEGPLAALLKQEENARLHEAIAQLGEMERAMIRGFMEKKTLDELARENDCSISTVQRYREKGLADLRRKLGPEFGEE